MNDIKLTLTRTHETLAAMSDWMSLREIALVRNTGRGPAQHAIDLLFQRGLVDKKKVVEDNVRYKFRRSEKGSTFITPKEPMPEVESIALGDNPFLWRTYVQPVPAVRDLYPNQQRRSPQNFGPYI